MGDEDIYSFLRNWGLEHLSTCFKEHKITMFVLLMLTENDIDRLIPYIGDCAVFKTNWKQLKTTDEIHQVAQDVLKISPEQKNIIEVLNDEPETTSITRTPIKGYYNLQSLLESTNEGTEESSNIAVFLAIAHLHGATTITYRIPGVRKTKIWRPSNQEIREGFIYYVTSTADVKSATQERTKYYASRSLTVQPFIMIVGPSLKDISIYLIVVNNKLYTVHNIKTAVDLCFKIYFALNCRYSPECSGVWYIIQRAMYNLYTDYDQ